MSARRRAAVGGKTSAAGRETVPGMVAASSRTVASPAASDLMVDAPPAGVTDRDAMGLVADGSAPPRRGRRPRPAPLSPAPRDSRYGISAPYGVGDWGGRRLLYRGDEELESLTNGELHVKLLDLLLAAARSRADRRGGGVDRMGELGRAPKVEVMSLEKAAMVAATVRSLRRFVKTLKDCPATFREAAEAVGVHRSTIYRRPEYRAIILAANRVELADDLATRAAADPEYARVARLTKAELIEEVRRAGRGLKEADAALVASLAKVV